MPQLYYHLLKEVASKVMVIDEAAMDRWWKQDLMGTPPFNLMVGADFFTVRCGHNTLVFSSVRLQSMQECHGGSVRPDGLCQDRGGESSYLAYKGGTSGSIG